MRKLSSQFSLIVLALIANATAPCGRIGAAEPAAFQLITGPAGVKFRSDGRTMLDYCPTASPLKPYVRELYTPGGVQILRDSPPDHKHHHGLMFALAVDGVNFWEQAATAGSETPRGPSNDFETATAPFLDASCTRIRQTLDWTDAQGKKLLVERREIGYVAPQGTAPVTLVLWNSELSPADGLAAVKLSGHAYYGLGMRFLKSMDTGGRLFNASKQPGDLVGDTGQRLVTAKWCAYTAKAEGRPVTAAIFDHPSNPRHPNKMFTMISPPCSFAYLAATLGLWKEPLVLKAGAKLKLSYAVAVWDGETPAEQVESLYEKWSKAK